MPGLQPQSLVSLWRHPDDCSETQFVCSGVIVAERVILTVAHPFDDDCPPGWVRPYADGAQSYPLTSKTVRHATLDAALARIEEMPVTATVAPINPYGRAQPDMPLYLNGYRKGLYEAPDDTSYMCFEAKNRRHVISSKQPQGYSGCGVSQGDQLWGIAFAHYTDANVHRGCVISCGQLWDGFLDTCVQLPLGKLVNLGAVQPHEVDKKCSQIRRMLADNDFQAANAAVLDFAHGHGIAKEIDDATLISMSVHEFLRHTPGLEQSLSLRKSLAGDMLALINEIMERLIGGHDEL